MLKYVFSIWMFTLLVCFSTILRQLYGLYQDRKITETIEIYLLGLRNGRKYNEM